MNKTMTKKMTSEEYALFRMREEIAGKFLEKLPNKKMEDIEVLPALEHYIRTGKKEMFREFCKFHFSKEGSEEKLALEHEAELLEKAIPCLKERIEKLKGEIRASFKDYIKYRSEYDSTNRELSSWRGGVLDEIERNEKVKSESSMSRLQWRGIRKFIDDREDSKRCGKQVWVATKDGLYGVEGVYFDEKGRIVLSTEGSCFPVTPAPRHTPYISSNYDAYGRYFCHSFELPKSIRIITPISEDEEREETIKL